MRDSAKTVEQRALQTERPGISTTGSVGKPRRALTPSTIAAVLRHPLLVALISIVAFVEVYLVAISLPGRIRQEDFADLYSAALILRHGGDPYRSSLAAAGAPLGLHTKKFQPDQFIPETPATLVCLRALGSLPLQEAYWTWTAVNFAAMVAVFYFLLGPGTGLGVVDVCLMVDLALIYPPLIDLFLTAQSQMLIVLALAISIKWLNSGRDRAAGLMLAAAALLRAFPVVMGAYLLAMRKWRALGFMVIGGVIGTIATVAVLGWKVVLDFPQGVLATGTNREFMQAAFNIAPASFIWRLGLYFNGGNLGPTGDHIGRVLGYAAALAILLFSVRASLRRGPGADHDGRLFALWAVTSILILPVSWLNYMVLLFVSFAATAWAAVRNRASVRAQWAAIASYFLSQFAFGGLMFVGPGFLPGLILVGESKTLAAIVGYASAYWLVVDEDGSSTG
jgi:Glycosyltransferase family 87